MEPDRRRNPRPIPYPFGYGPPPKSRLCAVCWLMLAGSAILIVLEVVQ